MHESSLFISKPMADSCIGPKHLTVRLISSLILFILGQHPSGPRKRIRRDQSHVAVPTPLGTLSSKREDTGVPKRWEQLNMWFDRREREEETERSGDRRLVSFIHETAVSLFSRGLFSLLLFESNNRVLEKQKKKHWAWGPTEVFFFWSPVTVLSWAFFSLIRKKKSAQERENLPLDYKIYLE